MEFKLKFICSEVRMSGGTASVKSDSLEDAKDKLRKALISTDKVEGVSHQYDYNDEYLSDSFTVDEIEVAENEFE